MNTELVVCRSSSGVAAIARIAPAPGSRLIVATDDPAVQAACHDLAQVSDVGWLEDMESVYAVAADVLHLLAVVNAWLRSLAGERTGFSSKLLCWLQHAEGGATTQRLQDAALLIRSYARLIDRHGVSGIVVCGNGRTRTFEDEVLVAVAASRGIPVRFAMRASLVRRLAAAVVGAVKTTARAPYRIAWQCIAMLRWKLSAALASRHESTPDARGLLVVFQLASVARKHVENIAPLMRTLERDGFRTLALTCFVPDGVEQLRRQGFAAEEVARFLPLRACVGAAQKTAVTFARAGRGKARFEGDPLLSYAGVALGPLLWPTMRDYLLGELFVRYCLQQAHHRFFERRTPAAMKLWGEVSLLEGFIAWTALGRSRSTLLFDYWLGAGIAGPYAFKENPIELFLMAGEQQAQLLLELGVQANRIVCVGSLRYGELEMLTHFESPASSREAVGVLGTFPFHVFWDPNVVMRGYLTSQEQLRVTEVLLEFAAASNTALIVKPHPSHVPGALEALLDRYRLTNVFRVPGEVLPYRALNAADVVVTKFSTIALEAMLLNKPVISVLLDDEPRWRGIFGDAVEYVTDTDRLRERLSALAEDAAYRTRWTESRLAAQRSFIERYFRRAVESPVDLASAAIAERLGVATSCDGWSNLRPSPDSVRSPQLV